jgi:hypothetical protein
MPLQLQRKHLFAGLASIAVMAAFAGVNTSSTVERAARPSAPASSTQTRLMSAAVPPTAEMPPSSDPNSPLVADPLIPRPPGSTPCVVTLLNDFNLTVDTSGDAFAYSPPAGCTGSWAKVVLRIDYSYDAGEVPDVTAVSLWFRGVNLHLGGTPWEDVGPGPWRVERDLTDYAPLFRQAGTGNIELPYYFQEITAHLHVTARLLLYPATATAPSPRKASAVFALGDVSNEPDHFRSLYISANNPDSAPSTLASTLTLPRNIERAYVDVLAFVPTTWWSCVPTHYLTDLPDLFPNRSFGDGLVGDCQNGSFREAEVRIDGKPAGVAPLYPWVPWMGGSIPTVRGLNLLPYRVDLTPFAGVLSDGSPHEIAVLAASSEPQNQTLVLAAASLLVFRDPNSTRVTGMVTRNTLAGQPALPTLDDTLQQDSATGRITGNLVTALRRQFVIDGYIDTARGRISSRVAQTIYFQDTQAFDNLMNSGYYRYQQQIDLVSKIWRDSYSSLDGTQLLHDYESFSYPLHMLYRTELPQGDFLTQLRTRSLEQRYDHIGRHDRRNIVRYDTELHNHFANTFASIEQGNTFSSDSNTAQTFRFVDNRGSCYEDAVSLTTTGGRSYASGIDCPGGVNSVRWFARPDGAPESIGWAGWQ